jgi:nitrogen regulatory protein PII
MFNLAGAPALPWQQNQPVGVFGSSMTGRTPTAGTPYTPPPAPAAAPSGATTNSGGNVPPPSNYTNTTTTNNTPAYNPAAVAAAALAAAQAKVRGYINDQVAGATATDMNSGETAGSGYQTQGAQLANTINQGQTAINQKRIGIATSQINSIKGLVDNIKQGLRGSAVNLGNSNALDSSAADAVGRIFSQYGNTQRNVINNDAATQQNDQDVAQTQLGFQKDTGMQGLEQYKRDQLDKIATQAIQQLTAIDGMGQLQGIGSTVDIQGIKNQVLQNAQQKIADADKYVQGLLGGINPIGQDDIATKAYALSNAGATGSGGIGFTPLDTNPAAPLGGAPNAQLPLYLKPKNS